MLATLWLAIALSTPAWAAAFRFSPAGTEQNQEMRLVLEVASLRLTKLLGVSTTDTITIAVVQTQAEFDSLAGGKLPEWGAGAAIPTRNLIILRKPMMNRYPGNTADLLQHELAHIMLSRRVHAARIPRFLDEGFASWFAGEWNFSQITTIAAAQITKSILPLRDIDDVNRFQQGEASLAYAQSYLVVNYIYKRYGEVAFLEFIDSLAVGQDLNDASRATFEIAFWHFEADYRKFLSENYTLFAILADMSGLWIILAVIVIFGWILIRKRKKDAYDRWKAEERYQSTDFDYSGSDDEPWKDSEEDSTPY